MAAALSLCMAASACQPVAAPLAQRPAVAAPLRVTNGGQPFAMDQGVEARRVAEVACATKGARLRTSIYDRFEAGAWVYPEGCV